MSSARRSNVVTESNQPEVLRAMVSLGEGWTVLPKVQAGDGLRVGRVVADRNLVLARRDGAAVDPVAGDVRRGRPRLRSRA